MQSVSDDAARKPCWFGVAIEVYEESNRLDGMQSALLT